MDPVKVFMWLSLLALVLVGAHWYLTADTIAPAQYPSPGGLGPVSFDRTVSANFYQRYTTQGGATVG
jgi:hypothetical protein